MAHVAPRAGGAAPRRCVGSRSRRWATALALLPACALAACAPAGRGPATAVSFDSARVVLRGDTDSAALLVEVARSYEQKVLGLSGRAILDRDAGMLFRYDTLQAPGDVFWMWRTRMPLDVAFIDSTWVIREVVAMTPCTDAPYAEACPRYGSGVPFLAALEVNRGWFDAHGVGVGSRVETRAYP